MSCYIIKQRVVTHIMYKQHYAFFSLSRWQTLKSQSTATSITAACLWWGWHLPCYPSFLYSRAHRRSSKGGGVSLTPSPHCISSHPCLEDLRVRNLGSRLKIGGKGSCLKPLWPHAVLFFLTSKSRPKCETAWMQSCCHSPFIPWNISSAFSAVL